MLRIAIDVDSVLANVIIVWLKIYFKKYNKKIEKKDVNTWDFWKKLQLKQNEFESLFTATWKVWMDIPPTENNISLSISKLNKIGNVDIVSGRTEDTIEYVKNWLKVHSINYRRFIYVPPEIIKGELDYDIFIDDSPNIILRAARKNKYAIIYDQPWNKDLVLYKNIFRVKRLLQAVDIINKITEINIV